ncbi:D-2-hydroxyacid dehydrogenase family protein [Aromatoleum evansii]|uniref:D-2-hydroxyacid dehydrogenase family protein n=1 Tax=Aromatoleum evansii TaxID=59406 RepID=UPI00145C9C77|nr:D-2-hydroxyacid dehydrogenase family protein [Aromatoleum evansii]NMG30052.1 D-2-hydroxyacid dehydrogenase family protein [Aromatoleum evansii]
MRVTVLDDYQGVVPRLAATKELEDIPVSLHTLTERLVDEDGLIAALQDTDCLVLIRERTQITARVVEALPRLKLIVQTGRLSGCIDLEACRRRGIQVRDGSGNPIAPTELTWALILAASRRLLPYAHHLSQGRWQRSCEQIGDEGLGRAVHGRTLGVWSLGKIGSRVAAIGQAFGMRVVVHGREQSREAAARASYEFIANRSEFLAQLDVLTLHLRLGPDTRHMIDADDLALMRPDALLVNTSRAELLAPGALLDALARGRPGAAALDVFEDEPDGVAPYLNHPAILCTPHLGFVDQDTYEAYFREAFAQVRRFVAGEKPAIGEGNRPS